MNDKKSLDCAASLHEILRQRINYIAVLFILLASALLCGLWIARYRDGNYDDKAVHYYSACRLFAGSEKAQMLENARSSWLAILPIEKQFRTDNRLSAFKTYLLPSSIMRILCENYRSSSLVAPSSFSLPFRDAMFFVHILAIGLMLVPAFRSPLAGSVLMVCFTVASFDRFNPMILAPVADYGYHYLSYAPRCSAIFLLAGAFLAFVWRQWITAGVMLVLIFLWHLGSGAIWCPLTLVSWGLSILGTCRYRKGRIAVIGSFLLLSILFSSFVALREQPRLWLPFVLFSIGIIMIQRLPQSLVRALTATACYLFLTQLVIILFDIPAVVEWLTSIRGNPLVITIPDRLSGTRHIASVSLFVLTIAGAGFLVLEKYKLSDYRTSILVGTLLVVFFTAVWIHRHNLSSALTGNGPFFDENDSHIERILVSSDTLDKLDPENEETFFASLGDFLIIYKNETQNEKPFYEDKPDVK